MTRRRAHLVGWMLVTAVTALSFVVDHFRMLTSHFNWFMAILMMVTVVLVGAIARLARMASDSKATGDGHSGSDD
jgi:cytochrome c oxidase subunit IV